MSTSTSTTGKTSTGATSTPATAPGTTPGSTVRAGLRVGEHVCAVQFAAWGPQDSSVKASSGGGRGGAPYVVVGVGTCLTYAYDQAAVDSLLCTSAVKVMASTPCPAQVGPGAGRCVGCAGWPARWPGSSLPRARRSR